MFRIEGERRFRRRWLAVDAEALQHHPQRMPVNGGNDLQGQQRMAHEQTREHRGGQRSAPTNQSRGDHRAVPIPTLDRNADLILVLDQGTIVERGTHETLLQERGYYTRLIQSQLESGEVKAY